MTEEEIFFGYARAALMGSMGGSSIIRINHDDSGYGELDYFIAQALIVGGTMTEQHLKLYPVKKK